MNHRKIRIFIQIFNFFIVLLFLAAILFAVIKKDQLSLIASSSIQTYGLIALFAVNFLLEFIPQFLTPFLMYFPALLAGLNIHLSVVIAVVASFFGSLAGYILGEKYGFPVLSFFFKQESVDKAVVFMNEYGKISILIAAVTPLPYIPMIIGSLEVSRKNFMFYGLIPRAIGLAVFGYLVYFGLL